MSYYFQKFLEGLKKKKKKMCAGLRLGCKDSSGSSDYILLLFFEKCKRKKTPGITPLCWVLHSAVCKAEMVGHQASGSDCHSAGHHPVPMGRGVHWAD